MPEEPNPPAPPAAVATATVNGNMGLRGLWALIGNSTSMVIICVFLFILYRDFSTSVRENMEANREEYREQRKSSLSHGNDAVDEMKVLSSKLDTLNSSVTALTAETKASRQSLERIEWIQRGGPVPLIGPVIGKGD